MQTEKISGYFDVRKYDKKVERKDRKILGETDNITFNTSFSISELPEMFKEGGQPEMFKGGGQPDEFVKLYASRDEMRAAEAAGRQAVADRASVKFKIGSNCKWFDKYGKAATKPTNEELDGEQFEVQIDFKRKPKNPADDKAPSGYWVNAIMFRKKDSNPFAGQAFEQYDEPEPEAVTNETTEETNDENLLFD